MLLGNKHTPFNLGWVIHQIARDAHIGTETRIINGRVWEKTLAQACPWCQNVFFIWQPLDSPRPPYDDPKSISPPGMGQRETCGHPICWDKEQTYQMKQTENYQNTAKTYWNSKENKAESSFTPKPKLVPLTGPKR
jgi:hypothetical protein